MAESQDKDLEYQYYGINFKIITDKLLDTNDIQEFTVIRSPLHKLASFAILTCAVANEIYVNLESYIRLNQVVLCELTLNEVDNTKNIPAVPSEKQIIRQLVKKTYYLDYCKMSSDNAKHPEHKSLMPVVNFFLINPSIWFLYTRRNYNILLENVTALEALDQVEAAITTDFKNTFNFKDYRLGIESNKNKYKYEQLLIRAASDIIAPVNIIKNYKVINGFSFYFFDDFYYTDDLKSNLIPVFFINLNPKTPYKKVDVLDKKYKDLITNSKLISSIPITDKHNFFKNEDKKDHVINLDSNGEWKFTFNKEKGKLPKFSGTNKKIKDETKYARDQYSQDYSFLYEPSKGATDVIKLYSPERGDVSNSVDRYFLCSDLFRNQLLSINTFKADSIFFDLLQFDRIYNLEMNNVNDFSHVLVAIINQFHRKSTNEHVYKHSARFQTLQFKPNKIDGMIISVY
jgi:hypothetical protein